MKKDLINELFKQFEKAATTIDNVVCWSARDLYPILGYTQWRNFMNAIDKAKVSFQNSGQNVEYHFADVSKTISMPKSAEKTVEDVLLTRYACYLIAQNGSAQEPSSSRFLADVKY